MKTLLLLRHAKSSHKHPELPDHDRPLNKRGQLAAPRMGALLVAEGLVPDLIVCSTAARARATAGLVAQACGYAGEVRPAPQLYLAGPAAYLDVLRGLTGEYERVLVVGHNPGLEALVEALTGETVAMPTAALAQVTLSLSNWWDLTDDFQGRLANIWLPKGLA